MKVLITRSFVDVINGQRFRANEGDEIELPKDATWIEAGLAVPLKRNAETAVAAKSETAVKSTKRKKAK